MNTEPFSFFYLPELITFFNNSSLKSFSVPSVVEAESWEWGPSLLGGRAPGVGEVCLKLLKVLDVVDGLDEQLKGFWILP